MNILWISDGKKGHEKQVEILLNEISKTENINIKKEIFLLSKLSQIIELLIYSTSLLFGNLFLNKKKFLTFKKNKIDVVIGAGSSIYIRMLLIKSYLSKNETSIKAISILTPNLYKNHFDIICAPMHDIKKVSKRNRLSVFRSNTHIYAQLIDDIKGVTLASSSSLLNLFPSNILSIFILNFTFFPLSFSLL